MVLIAINLIAYRRIKRRLEAEIVLKSDVMQPSVHELIHVKAFAIRRAFSALQTAWLKNHLKTWIQLVLKLVCTFNVT